VVAKGNLLDRLQGLRRLQAQLRAAVKERGVKEIVRVVLHPGRNGLKKLLFEAALVHDGHRVERLEPEVKMVHERLLGALRHAVAAVVGAVNAVDEIVGQQANARVRVEGHLDGVLERVVGSQLLVYAHVGLEHGVELGARLGVEVVVDLVLEHVLREGDEGRGHFGGYIKSWIIRVQFFRHMRRKSISSFQECISEKN